jgi:hypothetical protein
MDKNTGSSGIGLSTVLTLIFVVLKLVGVIDWSWWWVVSPTLISTGLAILLIVGYVIYEIHDNKKYGFEYKKTKNDKWKF